jgi:hypothetical protein
MPAEAWPLPETAAIALTNMIKSSVKLPVRVSGAMALSKLADSARSSAGPVLSTDKALGETGQLAVAGMKLAICGSLRADSLLIEATFLPDHAGKEFDRKGVLGVCAAAPLG